MASKKKPKYPLVVPVSVRTGKVIKYPKKGQAVKFALRGTRGKITLLRKEPQKFYKTDLKGLNKIVVESKKGNFVIQEQKLRTLAKDKKGKIQYRVDAKGKKHKIYETKLTFAKPRAKTKPILYAKGKKLRALDLAFKKNNYQNQKQIRQLTVLKPNAKVHSQILKGRTIKDALSNIQVNVNMRNVRKHGFGVYYNIYVVITTPTGEIIKVPVSAEFYDREFTGVNYIPVNGKLERFGRAKIKILANLQSKMASSIRQAFKNTGQGYTFTSLPVLEQIEKREQVKVKKAEKVGNDILADKLMRGISGLYFGLSNKKKFFINKKTRLINLRPGYKITMYVKFEVMDE